MFRGAIPLVLAHQFEAMLEQMSMAVQVPESSAQEWEVSLGLLGK